MDSKDAAFLKRLMATFRAEAAEHRAAIASGLIELEKAPPAERASEVIEAVFREAHSMKGAARAVNLTEIESVCQSFESVLAALKRKELTPARALLDLLHRAVNVLDELLSSSGGDIPAPEKAKVRELISDLNKAARDRKGGAAEQPRAAVQAPPIGAETSTDLPALASGSGDTVRISKARLDTLVMQGEGFISIKLAASQRAIELRSIIADAQKLRKHWAKLRSRLRTVGAGEEENGPSNGSRENLRDLFIAIDSQEEQIAQLFHALAAFEKTNGSDQRSIASMVDGFLDDLRVVSMLPFSSLLEIMPKVVRDLSHAQGKETALTIRGAEIEIDKRILDEIKDPLIHIVRNCIDHGIEKPEERVAGNKSRTGTITIEVAYREGQSVEVIIADDGRGFDAAKIRGATVRLGILSQEEADRLDERQTQMLAFRSGVSSSSLITDISGRGLGLAIVRERVERLGGSLFLETTAEKGTTIRILLPLTLATFRGLLVKTSDRHFIIPATSLDSTVRVRRDEIKTIENRETILIEGRTVPIVSLQAILELPEPKRNGTGTEQLIQVAVLGTADNRIAFSVDEILHEQEVLVKNLGKQLVRVRNILAATVLGTGEVVPILNASDLMKSALKEYPAAAAQRALEERPVASKSILVAEDSITSRTLLKNILEAAGYRVQTAVDGVEAFTALKNGDFSLVVSDVDMPRMNGFDLTARIRADKALADLPVVLVTALQSREDQERGIDVGANAYIVKSSFDQSNLLEVIRRLL